MHMHVTLQSKYTVNMQGTTILGVPIDLFLFQLSFGHKKFIDCVISILN